MNRIGGIDPKHLKAYENPVGPTGERQNSQEKQEKSTRTNRTKQKKDQIALSSSARASLQALDEQFAQLLEAHPEEQHLFGLDSDEQPKFNPHGRRLLASNEIKARAKQNAKLNAFYEQLEQLNQHYQEQMEALRDEQLVNQATYKI